MEEIRMVLGSMGPVPVRSLRAEAVRASRVELARNYPMIFRSSAVVADV
ncbi:MAG: hypothetical protein U9Q00_01230 [Synergistota bacterium]|nr:hypothetical protein [Synergistota bacterium]